VLERLAKRFARAREIDGDDYVRMNVVYACPTVELAQQNAETYRSFGGRCTVSLGRDYNFDKDPDSTPCKIPRVVRAIQKAGIAGSIQTSLCRKVDQDTGEIEFCDHFHDCAYQRQFDPEADVHFVAHSHLMHVMSEANYGRIELLVIDESFLGQQTTKKKLIAPHALVHDPYGVMVVEAMRNGVNPWHAFRDAGITVAMIEARITTLVALSEKAQPPVFPNISTKKALEAFHPEKGWKSDPLIPVLRRIRDEYKIGREGDEPIRCLAYNPSHHVSDKSGTQTTAPMIYLQYRSSFKMLRKDMRATQGRTRGSKSVRLPKASGALGSPIRCWSQMITPSLPDMAASKQHDCLGCGKRRSGAFRICHAMKYGLTSWPTTSSPRMPVGIGRSLPSKCRP
jgi:hypothetical protein